MGKGTRFLTLTLLCISLASIGYSVNRGTESVLSTITIVSPSEATTVEYLAAQEVRRYVYLRTGKLLTIVQSDKDLPSKTSLIIVGRKDRPAIKNITDKNMELETSTSSLKAQQYLIKTINLRDRQVVLITSGDSIGTLYAAYRFDEHLGVRFYLHGDTIPDKRIALKIPDLDEKGKPLFETRGIQPFHDFPEGPDWWNTDDYKAVMAQLPKLRMNFFGLHTYPQGGVGPEPTVWIGLPDDFNEDGTVKFSYPSRHFTTAYTFGTAQLYERDDYGPDYMRGMNPWMQLTQEKSNELFNRMSSTLKDAFAYAHALGVKTCVGTETPRSKNLCRHRNAAHNSGRRQGAH